MSNPVLVVDSDYTVYMYGRKLALCSPPRVEYRDTWGPVLEPRVHVSFSCMELPQHRTPPPPKRSWSRAMGLRKPR